jgi:hypothetical protein
MLKFPNIVFISVGCLIGVALTSSCSSYHKGISTESHDYCKMIKEDWRDRISRLDGNQQRIVLNLSENNLSLEKSYKQTYKSDIEIVKKYRDILPKPILVVKIGENNTCLKSWKSLNKIRAIYNCNYMECFLVK